MFFIFNGCPSSQAERRGFESHLPLHLFNDLGTLLEPFVTAITALSLPCPFFGRLDPSLLPLFWSAVELAGAPDSFIGRRSFPSVEPQPNGLQNC